MLRVSLDDFDLDGDLLSNWLIVEVGDTEIHIVAIDTSLGASLGVLLDLDRNLDGEVGVRHDLPEGKLDLLELSLRILGGIAGGDVEALSVRAESSVIESHFSKDGFAGARRKG